VSGRSYDARPKNRRALEQRLRNVIADTELQQRARRQLGYVALTTALMRHARDERDEPLFLIKGGVAVELLLGLKARATKDLDASARLPSDYIGPRLRAALAHGWEGFAFRLIGLEQVRDTRALRGIVKVSYQGDPWSTVQFEASPAEGTSGHQIQWTGGTFVNPERLGLPSPGELPLVTIAYLIAQKLHACTDHTDPERPNDRYRDLIDLILVDRLLCNEDRAGVREVCVEIFSLRGKHSWPPHVTVLPEWPEGYRALAERLGFAPADVNQAATDVQEIITRIHAASPTTS
jgi:hypothetical protein